MKILFIGGTGNISTACVRLALKEEHSVTLLNRGNADLDALGISGAESLIADIHDESATAAVLNGRKFDAVANFIAFKPEDVERDIHLFKDRCQQYLFISSASAYEKPPSTPFITESTPLKNPFWAYSRDKIACEEKCMEAYQRDTFPVTIVRPSLTYETVIPVAIGGWDDFTFIDRIRRGKPVIVHGDGTSLWVITHSADFAKGFHGLIGNQDAIGEAFHITSDEVLTWNQIYDAVGEAAGVGLLDKIHIPSDFIVRMDPEKEGSLFGDKACSVIFDNSKIKKYVPGFEAIIPFAEGIRETIKWFEEDPRRVRIVDHKNEYMDKLIESFQGATFQKSPT